jgi:hypothetical protein
MGHIKLKDLLNEIDWRINTKNVSGGGGKRFIPTEGKVPSRVFTSLPDHFKLRGSRVFVSPEAIIAMNSIQRGRGGATNYKELTGKIQQAFAVPRAGANLNIGPADTSSDLSVFKKGLTGRLDSAVVGGKEFKVWNGMGKGDEKGNFTFPLDQFKAMEENVEEYGIYEDSSDKFQAVRLINPNDFAPFIKSNPILNTIKDENTGKYNIYLSGDLVGHFIPKHSRIDFEKGSRFAKISDNYTWDRNYNTPLSGEIDL